MTALMQSQGHFCSSPQPISEEAGGTQEIRRALSQDNWHQLTKGKFHTIWTHLTRGTRKRKRVMFRMMVFVFLSHGYVWWSASFLGMAEHLSPVGSGELIPCLIWLCVWPLLSVLNCFYLNAQRVFWQFFCYSFPNPSER